MNKLFSKIAALSVGLAMAVGVGVAVGHEAVREVRAEEELVYTLDGTDTSQGSNGYATVSDITQGDVSWGVTANTTINPWRFGGKNISNTDRNAESTMVVSSEEIAKVVVTVGTKTATFNSLTVAVGTSQGDDSVDSVTVSSPSVSTDIEFTPSEGKSWAGRFFTIKVNVTCGGSNQYVQISSVKFYKESGTTLKNMRVQDNYHSTDPKVITINDETEYCLLAWDTDADTSIKEGLSWDVSQEGVLEWSLDSYGWFNFTVKALGEVTVTCHCDGYKDASLSVTVTAGTLTSIEVSGSMTKTEYLAGEPWSNAGLLATGTYDSGYVGDVTSEAAWTYSPSTPALGVTSVVATATIGEVSGNSDAQSVTVTKSNPLQVLYGLADNTSVDVYGIYVGFLDGTGPVIMDGTYGMVCYNKSADVSGYTAGETVLHVTGKMGSYNGLRQITSPVLEIASGEYVMPDTPVVYITQGGETAEYASRLTNVTGTAVVTKGSFDSDAGTADITMTFTVGSKEVQVFYKKAAQTADSEAFAAMKAAVTDKTEITIKGFTGWYKGFQVQMNGYVKPAEGYTAEDFAQDLLDQTDSVCAGWEEGVDNHDAIEAIWSNLASNDKYPSLPADQKTILAEAARDEEGTVVEQAMARYDFLTGKYDLNNFINGRTPVASNYNYASPIESSNAYIVIIAIASFSVLSFGLALALRKKRTK